MNVKCKQIFPVAVCLVAALAILPCAVSASVPIVDRAIEFHGGELFTATETRLTMCSRSGCSKIRAHQDGGQYEIEVESPVGSGRQRVVITNDSVSAWRDEVILEIGADQQQTFRDWAMARVYFCFLPYRLADPSVILEDRGVVTWDDRRLHQVKVRFAPGSSTDADDEYLYWFDPETGRLEMFAYSYDGGLRFRRTFHHRRVGGILFADQENLGINRDGVSVDEVDERFVDTNLQRVSMVELDQIEVRSLNEASK